MKFSEATSYSYKLITVGWRVVMCNSHKKISEISDWTNVRLTRASTTYAGSPLYNH